MDNHDPNALTENISPSNTVDDWGDFTEVIEQLESEEQQHLEPESLTQSNGNEAQNQQALSGLLTVMFTLSEKATSALHGIEFEFDEKCKQEVIEAATPVLEKHGAAVMEAFGDYVEEMTLLIAVLVLVYTSKQQITQLKLVKQEESNEQSQAANTAESNK